MAKDERATISGGLSEAFCAPTPFEGYFELRVRGPACTELRAVWSHRITPR